MEKVGILESESLFISEPVHLPQWHAPWELPKCNEAAEASIEPRVWLINVKLLSMTDIYELTQHKGRIWNWEVKTASHLNRPDFLLDSWPVSVNSSPPPEHWRENV